MFDIPGELLVKAPSTLEVWWSTAERKQAAVVPCYPEHSQTPDFARYWKRHSNVPRSS